MIFTTLEKPSRPLSAAVPSPTRTRATRDEADSRDFTPKTKVRNFQQNGTIHVYEGRHEGIRKINTHLYHNALVFHRSSRASVLPHAPVEPVDTETCPADEDVIAQLQPPAARVRANQLQIQAKTKPKQTTENDETPRRGREEKGRSTLNFGKYTARRKKRKNARTPTGNSQQQAQSARRPGPARPSPARPVPPRPRTNYPSEQKEAGPFLP